MVMSGDSLWKKINKQLLIYEKKYGQITDGLFLGET